MKQPEPITAIVFDLGGVLIDWDPMIPYTTHFGDPEKAKWFLEHICPYEWNLQMDEGKPFQEAISEKIAEHPDYEQEIRMYREQWINMLRGHIQGPVDILTQLHKQANYSLFAITNWSGETFPTAMERFPFLHYFKDVVVSGDEKMRKPFRPIFDLSIERFGINPVQAVFIDDSLANIETARSLGFHTIHLTDPETLEAQLRSLGIQF